MCIGEIELHRPAYPVVAKANHPLDVLSHDRQGVIVRRATGHTIGNIGRHFRLDCPSLLKRQPVRGAPSATMPQLCLKSQPISYRARCVCPSPFRSAINFGPVGNEWTDPSSNSPLL